MKKGVKAYKYEVVDRPEHFGRGQKNSVYSDIIDKLQTLEPHKALRLDFKQFVNKCSSMQSALYRTARARKINICVLVGEEAVTVWRKVQV